MKKTVRLILAALFVAGMTQLSVAAEHGGKEHGGNEHGGKAAVAQEHGGQEHGGEASMKGSGHEEKEPGKDDIRNAMKAHVQKQAGSHGGYYIIKDPDTGKMRKLSLIRVHERVGKTGDYYYSCADFKDVDSGEMLDLDLDVAAHHGMLIVKEVRIHKLEGEPRYTYDDNDNRIPLKEGTKSHLGSEGGSTESMMKGSGNEHGGKEHGGSDHKKEHGGKEHGGN